MLTIYTVSHFLCFQTFEKTRLWCFDCISKLREFPGGSYMPVAMLQKGNQIAYASVPITQVEDVLQPFHHHRRLITIVAAMAQEIERLSEDNAQLRAAVAMYREAARRGSRHALGR
jgi:hypothetical protein